MQTKIGIDIGKTIADYSSLNLKERLSAPVMKGAIRALKKLVDKYGAKNIFIISRSSTPSLAFISGIWLERNEILQQTGIPFDNIRICLKRKDKAAIASEIGITHMIDNSLAVLDLFPPEIEIIAFRPTQEKIGEYPEAATRAVIVNSWTEIEKHFNL